MKKIIIFDIELGLESEEGRRYIQDFLGEEYLIIHGKLDVPFYVKEI